LSEAVGTGARTVRAALAEGTRVLAAAGCDEPRLDAEVLLAGILGVSRAYLYAHPERSLMPEEVATWEERLARRCRREPLAYIAGHKEFYGLDFVVDPRVLVPRPETELIVERVLARAARQPIRTVWDVGTGSGALALTLARHLPGMRVVASDVSLGALQVAAVNRRRLGLEGRVHLVRSDLLRAARGLVDVVVANLPYLRSEEYREAMPEVSRYEPQLALNGGPTGLALVERLLAQARALDPPPTAMLLEIAAGQGPQVLALARECFRGRPVSLRRDLAGLDRVVEVEEACRSLPPPDDRSGRGTEAETHVLPGDDLTCIALAAEVLRRGGAVAFPTDTVYGLGAAAFELEAVQALYEIKGRLEVKAIPLLLADAGDLAGVAATVPPVAARLARAFWPGPLTLVLEAGPRVPRAVLAGEHTVAVRLPDHPVARALIEAAGSPLATTSANRSGAPDAQTATEVVEQLGSALRWVVDGGRSPGGRPSTVVDVTVDPPAIRRLGPISEEALRPLLADR
jgi:release factor glutamine methyltransferase